jgi:hypothetical protein
MHGNPTSVVKINGLKQTREKNGKWMKFNFSASSFPFLNFSPHLMLSLSFCSNLP